MGTWIAHLRIAENFLQQWPGLDSVAFVYGSLAPDSGVPNADWTAFDPPKVVTHFLNGPQGEGTTQDYLYYRQYLAPIEAQAEPETFSFRLAYFVHLLCDRLWAEKIGATTQLAYAAEIEADAQQAWGHIKDDWYNLDHVYVQAHPECLFWRVLAATPNAPSRLPFIPDAAFGQQMDYIRGFYRSPKPEWLAPRRYPYLNARTMDRIVADSGTLISQVWASRARFGELGDAPSSLALVAPAELAPYAQPLGDL